LHRGYRWGGGSGIGGGMILYGVPLEDCTGGVDEDFDGLVDCSDPDCVTAPNCMAVPYGIPFEVDCTNGVDDDGNGLADCADPDCDGQICGSGCLCSDLAATETECNDGIDNDQDGIPDCPDLDCCVPIYAIPF
jgi:hypothetical protein